MFDVGFTEIMLIGVVALVVIGPERLPAVAKTAGQWIAKLQRFVRGVKTDLASELQSGDLKKLIGDQREQINELKNMVSSAKKDFESSTRDVVQGAKTSLGELEASVNELDDPSSGQNRKDAAAVSAKPVASESGSEAHEASPVTDSEAGESSTEAGKTGSSSNVDAQDNSSSSSVSGKPRASRSNAGHTTSTMRTDSSGSLDDSADMNRTGTESGN